MKRWLLALSLVPLLALGAYEHDEHPGARDQLLEHIALAAGTAIVSGVLGHDVGKHRERKRAKKAGGAA